MRLVEKLLLLAKLYCVWFGAWLLGCVANTIYSYAAAEDFIFQGVNHGNDAFGLAFETMVWSFSTALIAFPLIYAPLMFGLRRSLGGLRPRVVFPLTGAVSYLLPTALLFMRYKRDWFEVLLSYQNINFHITFFFTGLFFGLGFPAVLSAREHARS